MFQPDEWQQKALKTWYVVDNPLHLDPRHPLIKLAGEAGEILDLYGKHEYKPGFSWWDCKCKWGKNDHRRGETPNGKKCDYTPLILDELGDWWYYLRIVTYQQKISIEEWIAPATPLYDMTLGLSEMNLKCARLLNEYLLYNTVSLPHLRNAFNWFCGVLLSLDCTLDRLTDLNYRKLNSEPTAHGWKR